MAKRVSEIDELKRAVERAIAERRAAVRRLSGLPERTSLAKAS